ncbi:bifunctional [glutamate--ammonia ligase]-adenylyl-L-tyrosine phosphorylase/[glutamate--ammonia-ligase] adenylyltransferase [Aestuariibacter sp. GS-14]|uniref:bifunctional [glutamate--ammonia ligase]-adenylyl-L-tyrosine phosphorylase/[glutamate--ammonia-ligase] adenylyltransferase n=1 Tax=Aestuariibacter sp. GS-14 TaxID=2590670 RepID=UPI0011286A79|nr:bifunctional [glutamate--ammonia ligase]-adenylyl-L-tyrosine phosphorylase/[glutamate--ammonia-ligase] adenylyltransferase [Aestuariibacter sp. GS-14]TPV62138.1 bifunctional [glutamate--ammonia ligase]-adenylyl-L-tyrosine phosphorylase/[glutamate--ammonia-ligase] adenylyltransferase [Aestuariibacter sp. GS-14]
MSTEKTQFPIIQENAELQWQKIASNIQAYPIIEQYQDDIRHVLGLSPFVGEIITAQPKWLADILTHQWHLHADIPQLCELLKSQLTGVENEIKLCEVLRQFRQIHMAALAWRDLTNQQSIDVSLSQVSVLADALIMAAYHWLYDHLCERHGTPQGPNGPQPMLILGMGKLGGHELNFSSDIDLIFAYPFKGETDHPRKPLENQQFFTKLAQKLISALNKVTVDGQVFRVDMRLRPFGESGPLVAHFGALEDYYQDQGRQWERYAMIKARVLNPPCPYRTQLEGILQPFIYRRYLDFTTLDAIRDMKRLINKELRRRQLTNNIKLGPGGIREVEFFAQSFQLIHGGREPRLQSRQLLIVLHQLVALKLIDKESIDSLIEDYYFLRKAEHTLQQFNDQQTQLLPDEPWPQQVLTRVMGYLSYTDFLDALQQVTTRIHDQFNQLVAEPGDEQQQQDALFVRCKDAWVVPMTSPEFSALFAPELSPENAEALFNQLNDFRQNLSRHRIGQKGEDTLAKLIPELLYFMLKQCPGETLVLFPRLCSVISAITGRTTYLDLLHENPSVLKQLIKLCARSEWITEQIRSFPLLLDELLTPLYLQQQQTNISLCFAEYTDELRQALLRVDPEDTEQLMEQWRQFKLSQQLRIAASDISGSLPIARVSDKLTALAEVMLHAVLKSAWGQVTDKFGAPVHLKEGEYGFLIVGYGKLGGYELGYGSDLDLVFLHNAPSDSVTTGSKSISAQQFYIKLSQRIMHLLNTKTMAGQLYETDLRLRPSGNAGLLCCHESGFSHYQEKEAWTWEHQALVRARSIVGDSALHDSFMRIRQSILQRKRELPALVNDVVSMREKMREHLLDANAEGLDLKQCEGGITDIEFMTQFWVLGYAHQFPSLIKWTDNLRIIDTVAEVGLISVEQAQALQDAYLTLRDHYHQLTLSGVKLASQTDALNTIRQRVSALWQACLAK